MLLAGCGYRSVMDENTDQRKAGLTAVRIPLLILLALVAMVVIGVLVI